MRFLPPDGRRHCFVEKSGCQGVPILTVMVWPQTLLQMVQADVLSRSRIIPLGGRQDPINEKGLQYYVKLVDDLIAANIVPMITLFHWDLPDALDKRYGGLLNKSEFVADFTRYSHVVFEAMGSKVKHWITFNEPWCSSILGYNTGLFAPGHTSDRKKSPVGDSSREPWIAGHNCLVAHGSAVKLYRENFKSRDGGEIGLTLNGKGRASISASDFSPCLPPRLTSWSGDWAEPWDPSDPKDVEACERKLEFSISWFADPIYHGHYPASMVAQLGDRLPQWTAEDKALVHGSNDFYGMNHYCANYIKHRTGVPEPEDFVGNLETLMSNKAGESIGPETQSLWLRPYPLGFRKLLKWLSDRYGRPKIYVTENGTSLKGENDLPLEKILEDDFRLQYFKDYVGALADAYHKDGVNVRGYMAWSLMEYVRYLSSADEAFAD